MKTSHFAYTCLLVACGAGGKSTPIAIEPLPSPSASASVVAPVKPAPTIAAFLDAGCKMTTSPGALECKGARIPGVDTCVRMHVLSVAFDPPAVVAECFTRDESRKAGIRQVGCMMGMSVRIIAATTDGFRTINTADELAKAFAPVTSPAEAMAFAVAVTGSEVVTRDDRDATHLGVTHALAEGSDFRVRLFSTPRCGCSHPTFGIDYEVTHEGAVRELARVQVWEDPHMRGLCVD